MRLFPSCFSTALSASALLWTDMTGETTVAGLTSHKHRHSDTHTPGSRKTAEQVFVEGVMVSVLAADPVVQCEAVTTNSRGHPTVPALRQLQFWESPAPVCVLRAWTLRPSHNVNIKMQMD